MAAVELSTVKCVGYCCCCCCSPPLPTMHGTLRIVQCDGYVGGDGGGYYYDGGCGGGCCGDFGFG